MPVNILGDGALGWNASIGTDDFDDGVKVIIDGLSETAKAAIDAAKAQNDAFAATADGSSDAARKVKKMQEAFDGFVDVQHKIHELNLEIAKMKAPGFADTDQGKALENRGQTLAYLNQQEKLLTDLQEVAGNYKKQLIDLSAIEVKAPVVQTPQTVDVSQIIGAQVLEELKKSFGEIDEPTQKFIQSMIELTLKVQNLEQAGNDLQTAFANGKISEQEYVETQAFLLAGIKSATDETEKLTDKQKEYQASLQQSNGSIDEKKAALVNLKNAYTALSEAQRTSPEGESMLKGIRDLSAEIKGLEPGKLVETKANVVSIRTELLQLTEQMARNPDSPMFAEWTKRAAELKENLKGVKTGIEQATNSTAGIDAFASGLRGLVGGFTAATGVIGLFSNNTEDVEKVTKNAASALALLNGIQEVSNVLNKNSALNVYLLGLMRKQNTVATIAETVATEANTVASEAQAVATNAAATAQRGLVAAMLANPAALLIAGITALAVAYLALSNNSSAAAENQKRLAEESKNVSNGLNDQRTKIEPLIAAVKEGNLTHEQQLNIYKQLNDINPELVAGIDAQSISIDKLNANTKAYLTTLENQLRVETKQGQLKEGLNRVDAIRASIDQLMKSNVPGGDALLDKLRDDLSVQLQVNKGIEDGIVLINKSSTATKNANDQDKRGNIGRLAQVEEQIKQYKDLQATYSSNRKEFDAWQKTINALEAERKSITGETDKTKSPVTRENKLLREQQSLLETIASLKRGSDQSSLTKEASELDKINEKYDQAIKKIEAFNRKAPKSLQIDPSQLNAPRQNELDNATAKQNLSDYKKSLADQQKVFDDFEKAKVDIGEARAKELFASQIKGSDSYMDYLKKQQSELEKTLSTSTDNAAIKSARLAMKANADEQIKENERITKKNLDTEIDNYRKLLQAAITYNEQRKAINDKFNKLEEEALKDKSASPEQTSLRLKILEDAKKKELEGVDETALHESDIYKKLNQDIIGFTLDRIKKETALLKKALEDNKNGTLKDNQGNKLVLPPEVVQSIEEYIKKLEDAGRTMKRVAGLSADEWRKLGDELSNIGGSFNNLSSALQGTDDGLSATMETMGDMINIAGDAASAVGSFMSGDIAGGIQKTVSAIAGIFSIGAKSRESERKAMEEVAKFQQQITDGELSINELYRERERQQIQINKLKLQGINDENNLLKKQSADNEKDFQRILELIQKQNQITGEHTEKYGGVLGIGRKTRVVQDMQSLAGTSYEDLQKLFLSGQLDEKAKALFEQLEKLKQEGVDIGDAIEQNKQAAQEMFTGTTSDSILDSIVQGFSDGKRASADFAGDFEKLMKQSILNALKFQALEKPLKDFYDKFAADAESDGILTAAEIAQLQASYNATIEAAGKQFDQLKQITDINFNSTDASANSLSGAIKGITQQQADLLAGQFGGLRITAFDILVVAKSNLNILNQIANNTSLLIPMESYLRYFKTNGIKII